MRTNVRFSMKLSRRNILRLAVSAAALPLTPHIARAQTYPSRPVRLIVPFAPGGQTDVVARLVAQHLTEQLGNQFFVENVGGAGGNIGVARAAQAAPDGYTIVFVDGIAFTANPSLHAKVNYDPVKNFEPVAVAASTMQVLAVHPSVEAKTIQELVALIKANPGKFSYASAGAGTGSHLSGELFRSSLKLDLLHVPYSGGGPAITAALAGHTPISFGSAAATIPQHKAGKLRALAVGGKNRLRGLPDVPTMRESGYAEVECDAWVGVLAPAGTPKDIVTLLHQGIAKAVGLQAVQERLVSLGFEPTTASPAEVAGIIKTDIPRWAGVIKSAGIKTE
jgi:tripartite-type tricarboxylate transporter receptor subunit TctC